MGRTDRTQAYPDLSVRRRKIVEKIIEQHSKFIEIKNGSVGSPKGFITGGQNIGMRRSKPDMGWIYSQVPAAAAGVYTTNLFQAAPLKVTKELSLIHI